MWIAPDAELGPRTEGAVAVAEKHRDRVVGMLDGKGVRGRVRHRHVGLPIAVQIRDRHRVGDPRRGVVTLSAKGAVAVAEQH